jgi:hypothetical protein
MSNIDEFARIVASIEPPPAARDEWCAAWTEHLKTCGPWQYEHPGGGVATFRPSGKTVALLAEFVRLADQDGIAAATYADLSLQLGVAEPASLASHIRALRHLGAIERYTRGRAGNLYRLVRERLPSPVYTTQ